MIRDQYCSTGAKGPVCTTCGGCVSSRSWRIAARSPRLAAALRVQPVDGVAAARAPQREVGVPLLIPSGRRVVLTPEAQSLADRAGEVLALLERAEAEVAARTVTVSGIVRLAIFQSAALALLPRTLTADGGGPPRRAGGGGAARAGGGTAADGHPRLRPGRRRAVPGARHRVARGARPPAARAGPDPARGSGRVGDRRARRTRRTRRGCSSRVGPPRGTGRSSSAGSRGSSPTSATSRRTSRCTCGWCESGNAVAMLPDLVWAGAAGPGPDDRAGRVRRRGRCSPRRGRRARLAPRSPRSAPRWSRPRRDRTVPEEERGPARSAGPRVRPGRVRPWSPGPRRRPRGRRRRGASANGVADAGEQAHAEQDAEDATDAETLLPAVALARGEPAGLGGGTQLRAALRSRDVTGPGHLVKPIGDLLALLR